MGGGGRGRRAGETMSVRPLGLPESEEGAMAYRRAGKNQIKEEEDEFSALRLPSRTPCGAALCELSSKNSGLSTEISTFSPLFATCC